MNKSLCIRISLMVALTFALTGACSGTDNASSGQAGAAGSTALGGYGGGAAAQGGSSGPASTSGTGVSTGTGGSSGVVTGSGGATERGGATGAGGKVGSGGTATPGGTTGTGGKVGSGGTTAPGGTTGAGGKVGSGGSTGLGGSTGRGGATGTGGSTGDCVYPSAPYGYLKGDVLPPTFAWEGFDGKGQPLSGNAKDLYCGRGGLKALHLHLTTDWCPVCRTVSAKMEEAFAAVLGDNWADSIMPIVLLHDGATKRLSSYCAARRSTTDKNEGDYFGPCAMITAPSDHMVSSSYGRADPANPANLIIIDAPAPLLPTIYRVELATMKIVRLTPEQTSVQNAARVNAEWVKSH